MTKKYFLQRNTKIFYILYSLSFFLSSLTLFFVWHSPHDYQQKISVKIMYIHVPCAWIALFCYGIMTFSALCYLYTKNYNFYLLLKCCAPLGAVFTISALISGALWGQLSWGTWWEWDARLTSFLILCFLYLLIIALGNAFSNSKRGASIQSILTLFGSINLPIIKFSVSWWNTLHQSDSFFKKTSPAIDHSMLFPLFFAMITLSVIFITLLLHFLKITLIKKRLSFLNEKIIIKER